METPFDVQLYLDQLNMEVVKEEKLKNLEAARPKIFIGSGEDVVLYESPEKSQ